MSRHGGAITWRTPMRLLLRFGLPLAGFVVIGYWTVASIGGNISKPGFALGVLLILSGFSSRLVAGR